MSQDLSDHNARMKAIGSVAIPPKGTKARSLLETNLKNATSKKDKKKLKKLWKEALSTVYGQQLNGAGLEVDQTLRYFQAEYNNRAWQHDLHSLPSSFNILEAFLVYKPHLNAFILNDEKDHLISFSSFVDWYTSTDVEIQPSDVINSLLPGVIYSYNNIEDPANLLYVIDRGTEVGISGISLVRYGTEISVMLTGGESEDLIAKTEEIQGLTPLSDPVPGHEDIKPDPDLSIEAVPLKSKASLWRMLALTRFDLEEMTQFVRYICHDAGNAFAIKTDDPSPFLSLDGKFLSKRLEKVAKGSAKEIKGYNALFDLCSTCIYLPVYLETFAADIVVDRYKTEYSDQVSKVSFQKEKKNMPQKVKLLFRDVYRLQDSGLNYNLAATIYSPPNFHIEASGYWRNLEPEKIGCDKQGNPINGRTWVSKKLSWMESDEPSSLVAMREKQEAEPKGLAPGFIYIMRSPLHSKNVFKVGTTQRSTDIRAAELSRSTGVPGRLYVMHEWAVGDCFAVERIIHEKLAHFRVDPRREFFEAPLKIILSEVEKVIKEYQPW